MRHIPPAARDTWATYIKAAREAQAPPLTKTELARRLRVDRYTIHRWETGQFRPDSADVVVRIADVLGLDLDEALAAAGLRPDPDPPREPRREPDPELDLIRESALSAERKKDLIRYVLMRRARDEQARLDDLHHMIRES